MENATKALLIAAAVLVAIILISMVMGIVTQGQETSQNIDMSELEIQAFNSKFLRYEGENVSSSEVDKLCKAAIEHNKTSKPQILIEKCKLEGSKLTAINVYVAGVAQYESVTEGARYIVRCQFNKGIITKIQVVEK